MGRRWCGYGLHHAPETVPSGSARRLLVPTSGRASIDAQFVRLTVPPAMVSGEKLPRLDHRAERGNHDADAVAAPILSVSDHRLRGTGGGIAVISAAPVAPGAEVTFAFSVIAPAPGTYPFQWRMVHELVEWFGPLSQNVTVTVSPVTTYSSATGGTWQPASAGRSSDESRVVVLEQAVSSSPPTCVAQQRASFDGLGALSRDGKAALPDDRAGDRPPWSAAARRPTRPEVHDGVNGPRSAAGRRFRTGGGSASYGLIVRRPSRSFTWIATCSSGSVCRRGWSGRGCLLRIPSGFRSEASHGTAPPPLTARFERSAAGDRKNGIGRRPTS